MKKFLILLSALFIMQTYALLADSANDTVWTRMSHEIIALEFSPSSNLLLSLGTHPDSESRRGVIIFNTEGDTVNQIYSSEGLEFIMGQGIWDAHFSQDGRYLATIWEYDKDNLSHGMLEIYETENWLPVKRIEIPGDMFSLLGAKVLISPDNNTVVAKTMDGFYFYDVQSGELIKHIWDYGQDMTKNVVIANEVYSKDGSHIYFTSTAKLPSSESKLRFLNTQTFEVDYTYNSRATFSPAISNDGRMLAFPSGLNEIAVEVMDIESKEIIFTVPGFVTGVGGLDFSPDNQYLAVVFGYKGNLNIYNIHTGDSIYNYTTVPSGFGLVGVSISSDQKYIVSSSSYIFLYKFLPTTGVENNPVKKENIIYPNPTNNSVSIRFNLNMPGFTNVVIYDNTGREVKKVFQGHLDRGEQNIISDVSKLKSGNYVIKVSSINTDISFKLIITK